MIASSHTNRRKKTKLRELWISWHRSWDKLVQGISFSRRSMTGLYCEVFNRRDSMGSWRYIRKLYLQAQYSTYHATAQRIGETLEPVCKLPMEYGAKSLFTFVKMVKDQDLSDKKIVFSGCRIQIHKRFVDRNNRFDFTVFRNDIKIGFSNGKIWKIDICIHWVHNLYTIGNNIYIYI